jgi:tetratricopeptide (TPR) repeat protein
MDDWPVIKENSQVTEIRYIPDYFTSGVWSNTDLGDQFDTIGDFLYRPLFLTAINIGHQLWGVNATAFHAVNLVLHSICTVLVFFLILGLTRNRGIAAALFGASLFAVHPVHVESVAWIAGFTDPFVSALLLGTALLHRRYAESGRSLFGVLALLCYGAGLLSKEVAVFFPLVLAVEDWALSRLSLKRFLPYAAMLVAYFVARSAALGAGVALSRFDLTGLPVLAEFFLRYVHLVAIPCPLEFYYAKPATNFLILGSGILVLAAAVAGLARGLRNRDALPVVGVAWFVITLLPALPLALLDTPTFAIRALYLPTVGLSLLAAWLLESARGRIAVSRAAWGVVVLFALISFVEVSDWANDVAFYSRAVVSNPQSAIPYEGLSRAYEREGRLDLAIEASAKATELATRESRQLDYLETTARLLGQSGDIERSERFYREILTRAPRRSSAWVGMGNNAWARKDLQAAVGFYHKAYDADPTNYAATFNLAMAYRRLGEEDRARHYEELARQRNGNR